MNIGNDPPDVTVTGSGSSIAGTPLGLTCNVILAQVLRERPVIEWVQPNGTKIENGTLEDVSVFSSSPSTTLTLIFPPLHIHHGGIYWCRASVMDSDASLFLSANSSYNLFVQSEFITHVAKGFFCTDIAIIFANYFLFFPFFLYNFLMHGLLQTYFPPAIFLGFGLWLALFRSMFSGSVEYGLKMKSA